jgi:hypothetical protein
VNFQNINTYQKYGSIESTTSKAIFLDSFNIFMLPLTPQFSKWVSPSYCLEDMLHEFFIAAMPLHGTISSSFLVCSF